MNRKTNIRIGTSLATTAILAAMLVSPAFAQITAVPTSASVQVTANANANTSTGSTRAERLAAAEATAEAAAKAKAAAAIDARLTTLTNLSARINAMVKVSASEKQTFSTTIAGQQSALTALQTQIAADTSSSTLKTDIASITGGFRIYILIVPQYTIFAAADRMSTIASSMSVIGTKIQTRITTAQDAGANVTAAQTTLNDYNAKLTDVTTQYNSIQGLISGLMPDNGNATIQASNHTALVSARADLKLGTADLVAARKDLTTLLADLKGFEKTTTSANAGANATVGASATTQTAQ